MWNGFVFLWIGCGIGFVWICGFEWFEWFEWVHGFMVVLGFFFCFEICRFVSSETVLVWKFAGLGTEEITAGLILWRRCGGDGEGGGFCELAR
jgi:hypothetical protein